MPGQFYFDNCPVCVRACVRLCVRACVHAHTLAPVNCQYQYVGKCYVKLTRPQLKCHVSMHVCLHLCLHVCLHACSHVVFKFNI